jgi:hypothetical protein
MQLQSLIVPVKFKREQQLPGVWVVAEQTIDLTLLGEQLKSLQTHTRGINAEMPLIREKIVFWIVALLHGLALGFDLSMVSWWLRGLCVVFTVIFFVLALDVLDYLSKRDVS